MRGVKEARTRARSCIQCFFYSTVQQCAPLRVCALVVYFLISCVAYTEYYAVRLNLGLGRCSFINPNASASVHACMYVCMSWWCVVWSYVVFEIQRRATVRMYIYIYYILDHGVGATYVRAMIPLPFFLVQ